MMLCDYGCGQEGEYKLKNGKWCCKEAYQKCPSNRKKYSQPGSKNGMYGKECVFKGKTKENYKPLKIISKKIKEHHENGNIKCYFLNYWKGKKHTDETKLKIAKKMVGNNYGKGRGKITVYNGITFRSTWEAKVAEYLDLNNIEWLYEHESYILTETSTYKPDFFIYNNNKLIKIIEVKGYFWKDNIIKYNLFKQLYPNIPIELWDKTVLTSLNII